MIHTQTRGFNTETQREYVMHSFKDLNGKQYEFCVWPYQTRDFELTYRSGIVLYEVIDQEMILQWNGNWTAPGLRLIKDCLFDMSRQGVVNVTPDNYPEIWEPIYTETLIFMHSPEGRTRALGLYHRRFDDQTDVFPSLTETVVTRYYL